VKTILQQPRHIKGRLTSDKGIFVPILVTALAISVSLAAAEHRVTSAADITRVSAQAKPGDVLVMSDGEWKDQAIDFNARGTAEKPLILRAQGPGKVILSGRSSVTIDGEHLVVSGLLLQHGTATGDGVKVAGRHNQLTESAVVGGSYKFFVHLFGTSNRVDHCFLAGKTNDNPTLQVEVEGRHNYHVLDHNHFGYRPPLGRNGGETIRVGYSHQSMTNSGTLVEHNLFEHCDGELEIISSKSCENIYRANTFLDCAGMLTLRHGNRCVVEGNFFLGHHTKGSGGIRIIGDDHVIINNYLDGVENGGFWITSGISNSELKGYFQARNAVIAFNTLVDSRGPALVLDAGFGSSGRTLRPENITIATNLFSLSNGPLTTGTEGGRGYRWLANVTGPGSATERTGLRVADLKLERGKDGLWHPAKESPVPMPPGQTPRRPLVATDVGPGWMDAKIRSAQ